MKNTSNYLPGVIHDINNFYNFLISHKGGSWKKEEIYVLINENAQNILEVINQLPYSDYRILYFSGHGFTQNKNQFICLDEYNDVKINELINKSDRELIIIDSCRSLISPELGGDIFFEEIQKSIINSKIQNARIIFDDAINKSEKGSIIVNSTSLGEAAHDTGTGGVFTKNLLKIKNIVNTKNYISKIVFFNSAFDYARKQTKSQQRFQVPDIKGSIRRNHWFPFMINI